MLKYILISFLIITNAYAYTCEEMGYTKSIADCPEGGLKCPAQPEKMFCCDPCGNKGVYRFNEENCSADDGLQLAGIECGGRWSECRECSSEYKYNKDNCRAPKILAGVQCGNAYTQCIYPNGSGCVPTVGYIYYADGSCHAEYDDTKVPIGIIVDAARKVMVSLDGEMLPWNDGSTDWMKVPDLNKICDNADALLDMDGQANTDKIVAFAISSGQEQKAAEYCANKTDGNKKWYLPAFGEVNVLHNNLTYVQNALSVISVADPIAVGYYFSSSQCGDKSISIIDISSGKIVPHASKDFARPVRCLANI